jgi:hypothetical protein
MATWRRQPQEVEGNYFFSGQFLATARVNEEIPKEEIFGIYLDTKNYVLQENGIDYLQIFTDENGRTLWLIDATPKDRFDSGECDPNDIDFNNCVLCFPEER